MYVFVCECVCACFFCPDPQPLSLVPANKTVSQVFSLLSRVYLGRSRSLGWEEGTKSSLIVLGGNDGEPPFREELILFRLREVGTQTPQILSCNKQSSEAQFLAPATELPSGFQWCCFR